MSCSKFIKIIKFTSSQKICHHCISQLDCQHPCPTLLRIGLWFRTFIHFVALVLQCIKQRFCPIQKSNKQKQKKKNQIASSGTRIQYHNWIQVLILSITLHGSNFKREVSFYSSKLIPDYQLVCLCLLGYLNDYSVPQCPQLWLTGHRWPWPLTVRKLPKQQWAFLLDEFQPHSSSKLSLWASRFSFLLSA